MIKILKQMETLNKLSSFLVNFYLLELLVLYIERDRERGREKERAYLRSLLSTLWFGKFYLLSEDKIQILNIFFEC